jgi:hypothetical protein
LGKWGGDFHTFSSSINPQADYFEWVARMERVSSILGGMPVEIVFVCLGYGWDKQSAASAVKMWQGNVERARANGLLGFLAGEKWNGPFAT